MLQAQLYQGFGNGAGADEQLSVCSAFVLPREDECGAILEGFRLDFRKGAEGNGPERR